MSPLNYSGVYKIEHSGSDMRRITSCAGKEEIHNWPLGRDMYEYRVNVECHGPCKYISYFFIWECTLPPILVDNFIAFMICCLYVVLVMTMKKLLARSTLKNNKLINSNIKFVRLRDRNWAVSNRQIGLR